MHCLNFYIHLLAHYIWILSCVSAEIILMKVTKVSLIKTLQELSLHTVSSGKSS